MSTSNKNVTVSQIRALQREASAAGDLPQVVICDRALGYTDGRDDYMSPEQHQAARFDSALEMSEDEALAACVEIINAARD